MFKRAHQLIVAASLSTCLLSGTAVAQDYFDPIENGSGPDRVLFGLSQPGAFNKPEARATITLRIPFGGTVASYEESQPRLSLNLGLATERDWLSTRSHEFNGNLIEYGSTFDNHRYIVSNDRVLSLNATEADKEDAKRRRIIIGTVILAAAITAGSIIAFRESFEDAFGVD